MIATCVKVSSSALADHQQGRFAALDSTYPLTVGARYVVMAMGIWETILHVLVEDDDGWALWCPAGLFVLEAQPVPDGWEFALDEGIGASGADLWTKWIARWGYPEMVRDPGHSNALMERDPDAVAIFKRRLNSRVTGASES